jgi:predicted lipid-binding transport protein (Tim44 family)
MDNAFQYMDIIFLAIIAGLVLLRLRSVLGKRTGSEKKDPNQFSYDQPIKQSPTAKDKVINIKDKITHKSEWFNSDDFLEGANAAYETILTNFENGNLKTLKPLLDQEVLKSFTTVVDQRKQDQQNVEFSFIGIDSSEIIYKDLNSVPMEVTVRFVSEMITCIKNTKDEVISGSLNQVQKITDVWTFTKDKKIKSNNWLLAATSD